MEMLKHLLTAGVIIAASSLTPAYAQDSSAAPSAEPVQSAAVTDPQGFASKAGVANLFEVETSALAAARSKDADITAFAQQMVEDHSKAGAELQMAAKKQGLPPLPDKLDAAKQAQYQQLDKATGVAFDQLYVKLQTEAHVEAVALFSGYADKGPAGPLRDFAVANLPMLKVHYAMVQVLR
jgi:putative membrane protein